ncbi:MAG TPA: Holliday junction branch migration DNA helicase RuvB [Planctomycetes bacterium]|nr:Holliday junction branch migration DNA helicase RuvB [Planctomycetota bacterium]
MTKDSAYQRPPSGREEQVAERTLRPKNFAEFLGQGPLLEPLKVMMQAAKERSDVLEHLLFAGPPGLGKTSLAHVLGAELECPLRITSGPALERAKDLVGILSGLEEGSILFIDEIHRVPRAVEEYLYGAMDNFRLEFTLDQGVHARLLKLDLPPFLLVGATTREALLGAPLRSRFGHVLHFEPYEISALEQILGRSAEILDIECSATARAALARHSRGTPRIANRLLRRARDVAQVEGRKSISSGIVKQTFELLDIDNNGLERADRKVLESLARMGGGPIGLKTLSAAVDEAEDTIEWVIEPWLIRQGFLARSPQGRLLLDVGWQAIGQEGNKRKELPLLEASEDGEN